MSSLYYHQQQHQQEHNTNANNEHAHTRTQTLTRIRTQTMNRTQQDDVGQARAQGLAAQGQEQAALENKNLTMTTAATAVATAAAIEQLRFNHKESEQLHQTQQAQASSNFAMAAVAAEQQIRFNYEQQKQQQQAYAQPQPQESNHAMADAAAAEQLRFDHEEHQQQQAQQAHGHARAQQQQPQHRLRVVAEKEQEQEQEHHSSKSSRVLQELPPHQVMEGTQHQQYRAYHAHQRENQSHHQAAVQPSEALPPAQLPVVVDEHIDDQLQSEQQEPIQQHYIQSRDEIFDILESMMVQETASMGGYDIESYFPNDYDRESIHSGTPRQQNTIHCEWRSKICQWLYNVVDHYEMTREIVVISLNYFDRFMASMSSKEGGVPIQLIDGRQNADGTSSSSSISSNDLALLTSLTVLYVATKLHLSNNMGYDSLHRPLQTNNGTTTCYHNVPSLHQLAEMSRGRSKGSPDGFGVSSILAMEKVVLEQLEWKLHPPTLHSFISLLIQLIPTTTTTPTTTPAMVQQQAGKKMKQKQLMDDLYSTSIFIAELGICDPFFLDNNIPPSIQAFASICICMDDIVFNNMDPNNNTNNGTANNATNSNNNSNNSNHDHNNNNMYTKYQRDQFVNSICQRLGLCHTSHHQHMFHQSCIRLCAVYLEHQQQQQTPEHKEEEEQQEVVDPYAATSTAATATAVAHSSTAGTIAGTITVATLHPRQPSYHNMNSNNSVTSSPTSTATYMPSSPTSTTADMMSMSTMNSAMMAHSIADTMTTVGDYCGRSTAMTSVKRNDSLFSSSMGMGMGVGAGNDGNGSGGDTAVNVTRDDSMVSTTIGLARGESMVSSMSGCGPVATTAFARGESMVSSISGNGNGTNGVYYWNGESNGGGGGGTRTATPFDDDDDVNNNDMLRYSPSPPQLDYYSPDDY